MHNYAFFLLGMRRECTKYCKRQAGQYLLVGGRSKWLIRGCTLHVTGAEVYLSPLYTL